MYINIIVIIFDSNSAKTCWDVNRSLTSVLYTFKFKTLWKWFEILYIIKYGCLYICSIAIDSNVTFRTRDNWHSRKRKTFTWLKLYECGRAESFVLCTFNSRKILLSERRVTTIRKKYYSYNVCHLSLPNVNWWYKY